MSKLLIVCTCINLYAYNASPICVVVAAVIGFISGIMAYFPGEITYFYL